MSGYLLSPRAASALGALFDADLLTRKPGPRRHAGFDRPALWVRAAASGSLVSVTQYAADAGAWEDQAETAAKVLVGGSTQPNGRYLATRSGVDGSGNPVFAVLGDADQLPTSPVTYAGGLLNAAAQVVKGEKTWRDAGLWQQYLSPAYAAVTPGATSAAVTAAAGGATVAATAYTGGTDYATLLVSSDAGGDGQVLITSWAGSYGEIKIGGSGGGSPRLVARPADTVLFLSTDLVLSAAAPSLSNTTLAYSVVRPDGGGSPTITRGQDADVTISGTTLHFRGGVFVGSS